MSTAVEVAALALLPPLLALLAQYRRAAAELLAWRSLAHTVVQRALSWTQAARNARPGP